jgi:hypothetical protein
MPGRFILMNILKTLIQKSQEKDEGPKRRSKPSKVRPKKRGRK